MIEGRPLRHAEPRFAENFKGLRREIRVFGDGLVAGSRLL